jgi:hypothetical protein
MSKKYKKLVSVQFQVDFIYCCNSIVVSFHESSELHVIIVDFSLSNTLLYSLIIVLVHVSCFKLRIYAQKVTFLV